MTGLCDHCHREFERRAVDFDPERRKRAGCRNTYCSKRCFGLARRTGKTPAQRKAEKAVYDEKYRERNRARLKRAKAAYFQRTYNPEQARRERKRKMWRHVLYCRQPKYRRLKRRYDAERRAALYGPYADAYRAYMALSATIRRIIPDKYERLKAKGYFDTGRSITERKRDAKVSRY